MKPTMKLSCIMPLWPNNADDILEFSWLFEISPPIALPQTMAVL
jgi:hypothetical protein